MKKLVVLLAVLVMSLVVGAPVQAGVNDFYFSDFTGDYYLTRDEAGISHLKVVESVTAEFPEFNQNKGICRQIPFTNQDGANVTLPNLTRDKISVTRNGKSEPIYSIEKEGNFYNVCTGTEEYVLGKQVYVFDYEFENVVTDFGDYQELYWDTNGNGSTQRFDSVTARLHFEDEGVWTGKSWCYVGKYGESGQDRCAIKEASDGVEFKAKNLTRNENLTFDVELKEGSFVVSSPGDNYTLVLVMMGMAVICGLLLISPVKKYLKASEKIREYKGIFTAPQYQPSNRYGLAEMAEVYLGKKKDAKVGILLNMVVEKKIEIRKNEEAKKSRQWELIAKKVETLEPEEATVLELLNGGTAVKNGDIVVIQRRTATSALVKLGKRFDSEVLAKLKKDKLVEKDYTIGDGNTNTSVSNVIVGMIVAVPFTIMGAVFVLGLATYIIEFARGLGGRVLCQNEFYWVMLVMIGLLVITRIILGRKSKKYLNITSAGLKASKYMEGLKLYIGMAEAERIKFLQSVDTADTSSEGIVKLYEKLLPYAAIFGLEESWMEEMKEYCKVEEIEEPDYLMTGLAASEIARTMRHAASYATASTVMSSSGGGSSSGFSGGGGGGFSGGGGGGGGFGGR